MKNDNQDWRYAVTSDNRHNAHGYKYSSILSKSPIGITKAWRHSDRDWCQYNPEMEKHRGYNAKVIE